MHGNLMTTDLGKEKRCARCGEYWPLDREFWTFLTDGRPHSYCKACCAERKQELRAGAPRKIERRKVHG